MRLCRCAAWGPCAAATVKRLVGRGSAPWRIPYGPGASGSPADGGGAGHFRGAAAGGRGRVGRGAGRWDRERWGGAEAAGTGRRWGGAGAAGPRLADGVGAASGRLLGCRTFGHRDRWGRVAFDTLRGAPRHVPSRHRGKGLPRARAAIGTPGTSCSHPAGAVAGAGIGVPPTAEREGHGRAACGYFSVTPAESNVATSCIARAALWTTGSASSAPVPSPRRRSRSTRGRRPSLLRAAT